ncbi:class I SAM-dependent methyltransferase [Salinigranum halophilum]|uniref:class I SAM-dependent methyltransferase n=1 Tax=Salinigranum halophilum TaxID=2565931 RepID=UPI001F027371|nr:methyltransferase domain-containing protein [Salinigranum halophilum]
MTRRADGGVATTQAFYSRWARLYDTIARRAPGVQSLRERAAERLAPPDGGVVVDMGCGTGANLPSLAARVGPAGRVLGVDFTPGVLEIARDRRLNTVAGDCEHVGVVRGDATRPPVRDADAVFASFVSGMLTDPASVVHAWADIVGPGGRLGLLDLARSTHPVGRPLNDVFRLVVRGTSPPGTRSRLATSPAALLDRRVVAAHRALFDRCVDVEHETHAMGYARLSVGTVADAA